LSDVKIFKNLLSNGSGVIGNLWQAHQLTETRAGGGSDYEQAGVGQALVIQCV
jgi:hypothetical protein